MMSRGGGGDCLVGVNEPILPWSSDDDWGDTGGSLVVNEASQGPLMMRAGR